METQRSCLIIGAGLAGLLAGQALQAHGWQVTILDKGRGVGGRMATRRIAAPGAREAVVDHGAQYFTVRDRRFAVLVEGWQAAGIVTRWSNGFATADRSWYNDGHPRYRGVGGMTDIPKYLRVGLQIHLQHQVRVLRQESGGWLAETITGERFEAAAVILTPPVPQSLALLVADEVDLPGSSEEMLRRLEYDPCLAVLAVLGEPSDVPEPGGMWPEEPIGWLADNRQKGISAIPALTIHATPEFSLEFYAAPQEDVIRRLLEAAAPWIGAPVLAAQLQRWRYSIPRQVHPEPCLYVPGPPALVFAGDAFAGPRVEGAALSGLAAADALLGRE